jgi:hypothetical protein
MATDLKAKGFNDRVEFAKGRIDYVRALRGDLEEARPGTIEHEAIRDVMVLQLEEAIGDLTEAAAALQKADGPDPLLYPMDFVDPNAGDGRVREAMVWEGGGR